MRLVDAPMMAVLAAGLLTSMVLLSASSAPPSVTVSQLWGLDGDTHLTVCGVLVSLRSYESGSEVMVVSDESGSTTVKVVCAVGPGQAPSASLSIGDLLSLSGECVFEDGIPCVYCRYGDVQLLQRSEEVLTVDMVCASWRLFEGDRLSVRGVCGWDASGCLRLSDVGGESAIMMSLAPGVAPFEGEALVDCVLVLDGATMALVLQVESLAPVG
ncbi:MAG: hypothetical protein AB7S97_06170 [Thermoplasmata archaeon]